MIDANDGPTDWTGEDLDRLRALATEGLSVAAIADRLCRSASDVQDRLTLIHASSNLPSYGPDEEGDVPIPRDARIVDPAAWVHVDPERKDVAG